MQKRIKMLPLLSWNGYIHVNSNRNQNGKINNIKVLSLYMLNEYWKKGASF
jgi:hypothetical protein